MHPMHPERRARTHDRGRPLSTAPAVIASLLLLSIQSTTSSPTAERILQLALARAEQVSQENQIGDYSFRFLRVSNELDDLGRTKKTETELFESFPIEGTHYERLLERNGRPLDSKDLDQEREREWRFRQRLRDGKHPPADDGRVRFNRELVERYRFSLEGMEEIEERNNYVLSFLPRSDNLPVRRRIDRALNRSSGRIWVDVQFCEIARVEFELQDKIRLWWGLIGSISRVQGRVERREVEEDVWLASNFDFYLKGKMLFRSLHYRRREQWSNFRRIAPSQHADAEGRSAADGD